MESVRHDPFERDEVDPTAELRKYFGDKAGQMEYKLSHLEKRDGEYAEKSSSVIGENMEEWCYSVVDVDRERHQKLKKSYKKLWAYKENDKLTSAGRKKLREIEPELVDMETQIYESTPYVLDMWSTIVGVDSHEGRLLLAEYSPRLIRELRNRGLEKGELVEEYRKVAGELTEYYNELLRRTDSRHTEVLQEKVEKLVEVTGAKIARGHYSR